MCEELQVLIRETQIKRMISFIESEAKEKEEEIDTKTTELVAFGAAQMLLEGKSQIDNQFMIEEKKVESFMKNSHNREIHRAKMMIKENSFQALCDLKAEVTSNVARTCQNSFHYAKLMKLLILQSLYLFLNEKVILQVLKSDVKLIKRMLPELASLYFAKTKKQIIIEVDQSNFLLTEDLGGVILRSFDGRIFLINTVKARIDNEFERATPFIVKKLFKSKKTEENPP